MKKLLLILLTVFSFSSFADEVYDFEVQGDVWRVGIDRVSEILYLAKYDALSQRYKWKLNPDYSYNPNGFTAEQYFQDFIDKANQRIAEEYDQGGGEYPTEFGDILEYLIRNNTSYENDELIVTQ